MAAAEETTKKFENGDKVLFTEGASDDLRGREGLVIRTKGKVVEVAVGIKPEHGGGTATFNVSSDCLVVFETKPPLFAGFLPEGEPELSCKPMKESFRLAHKGKLVKVAGPGFAVLAPGGQRWDYGPSELVGKKGRILRIGEYGFCEMVFEDGQKFQIHFTCLEMAGEAPASPIERAGAERYEDPEPESGVRQ